MTARSPIIVLADDFSGAAELAGIAAARGWRAEVQTRFDATSDAEVIAVDTDTRLKSEAEAARLVGEVARAVVAAGPAWIFKKTDSVLRGHIRVELEATLDAAGLHECVFIPANPSKGRVIVGGRYLVQGVPLNETAFARDPEHPRRSAVVRELLGASARIRTPDAGTLVDLPRSLPPMTLAAGAADFFSALLGPSRAAALPERVTSTCVRTLLLCGSLAAWDAGRAEEMRQHGFVVKRLGEFIAPALWDETSRVMLAVGRPAAPGQRDFVNELVAAAQPLIQAGQGTCIAVEGGATAKALVHRCDWMRLKAEASNLVGVGALRSPDGSRLYVKPGSYPWPDGWLGEPERSRA